MDYIKLTAKGSRKKKYAYCEELKKKQITTTNHIMTTDYLFQCIFIKCMHNNNSNKNAAKLATSQLGEEICAKTARGCSKNEHSLQEPPQSRPISSPFCTP